MAVITPINWFFVNATGVPSPSLPRGMSTFMKQGWHEWWSTMKGWLDANKALGVNFDGVAIYNPWGLEDPASPYAWHGRLSCQSDAATNAELALVSNDADFLEVMNEVVVDYNLMIYVGTPHSIKRENISSGTQETQAEWVARALGMMGPVWDIKAPEIPTLTGSTIPTPKLKLFGMDATYGHPGLPVAGGFDYSFHGGELGATAALAQEIINRGWEPVYENYILQDADWAYRMNAGVLSIETSIAGLNLRPEHPTGATWGNVAAWKDHHARRMVQLTIPAAPWTVSELQSQFDVYNAVGDDTLAFYFSTPGYS